MKLYYASFTIGDEKRRQGIYTPEEFRIATFRTNAVIHYVTDMTAHSKEEAREIAMNIQNCDRETVYGDGNLMAYSEYAELGARLERMARRFGLVREFRENGII